jgi:Transposase domain (DUF772)
MWRWRLRRQLFAIRSFSGRSMAKAICSGLASIQILNMKHELVQLVARIDWDWIDREVAPLYSDNGRPGIATRFVIGLLLLKHIYGLSDEGVCERWVYDPYFQHFTGEEFPECPGRC